jgi:2'-5' RNA ligase
MPHVSASFVGSRNALFLFLSLPDGPHSLAVYFSAFKKMMEDMRELKEEEEEDKTHKCTHTKGSFMFHMTGVRHLSPSVENKRALDAVM